MSYYSDVIDAILLDLMTNVPNLGGVKVHKYASHDLQSLVADGKRHIAMWPTGEAPSEEAQPLMTGAKNFQLIFQLLYWEPSDEQARGVADETAAFRLLELVDEMRARLMVEDNRTLGNSWRIDWMGAELGLGGSQDQGQTRWASAIITAQMVIPFS